MNRDFKPIFQITDFQRNEYLRAGLDHCQWCDGVWLTNEITETDEGRMCDMCMSLADEPGMSNARAVNRLEDRRRRILVKAEALHG